MSLALIYILEDQPTTLLLAYTRADETQQGPRLQFLAFSVNSTMSLPS